MKKNRIQYVLPIVLVLLLSLSFAACGNRTEDSAGALNAGQYSYQESAVAAEKYGGFAAMDSYSVNGIEEPMEISTAGTGTAEPVSDPSAAASEKIIYEADATLESTEFDATITALKAMIEKQGGWIESSSLSGNSYSNLSRGNANRRSANYTLRFPSEKFTEVMAELSALGNVPYSHIYTENVTAQYYDTEARRNSYAAQEQRLLELLEKAETVSDVIEIENELTEVRYRIESLETSLRSWDRRVSWSTLYLTVNEVFEYTPEKPQSYLTALKEALSDGVSLLGDFVIGLAEILPVLLVIIFLLVLLIVCIGKVIRRSGKKKEKSRTEEARSEDGRN